MRLRPIAFVALAALVLLAACSSGGDASVPPAATLDAAANAGPYAAGVITLELVDTSRVTEPVGDSPEKPERTFAVEVWYPAPPVDTGEPEVRDAPLDDSGAPYPLIVFAHGLSGTRRQSVSYTQHLATHGYVVVAPDFPRSHLAAEGGPRVRAVINQPADVSFLIDEFTGADPPDARFAGVIDGDAIGVTGHSLGGLTTLLSVFGPFRDERIDAALPISAPACFLTEAVVAGISVPVMHVAGSRDLIVNPRSTRKAYDLGLAPRYWVEIAGADHLRFADTSLTDEAIVGALPAIAGGDIVEDAFRVAEAIGGTVESCLDSAESDDELIDDERQREVLRTFAAPFFDAYLRDSDEARAFLEDELPGLVAEARFEADTGE